MGRPPKLIGPDRSIKCVSCDKEVKEGYRLNISIIPAYITPDFFISYDSDMEEYDALFCQKECIIKYIQEVVNQYERGNGKEEEGGRRETKKDGGGRKGGG